MWLGFLTAEEVKAQPGWSDWLSELAQQKRATQLSGSHGTHWLAAERLPQMLALFPDARIEPAITAPTPHAARNWSPDDALVEVLRGRLEGLGPVTEAALSAPLGMQPTHIASALAAARGRGLRHAWALHAGLERR